MVRCCHRAAPVLEAALALVTDGAWYSGVMTTCKVHGVASGLLAVHEHHALHAHAHALAVRQRLVLRRLSPPSRLAPRDASMIQRLIVYQALRLVPVCSTNPSCTLYPCQQHDRLKYCHYLPT